MAAKTCQEVALQLYMSCSDEQLRTFIRQRTTKRKKDPYGPSSDGSQVVSVTMIPTDEDIASTNILDWMQRSDLVECLQERDARIVFPFTSLPAELRESVYQYLLAVPRSRHPSILGVSKILNREAQATLYSKIDIRIYWAFGEDGFVFDTTIGSFGPQPSDFPKVFHVIHMWKNARYTLRRFRTASVELDHSAMAALEFPKPTKTAWPRLVQLLHVPLVFMASGTFLQDLSIDLPGIPANHSMEFASVLADTMENLSPKVAVRLRGLPQNILDQLNPICLPRGRRSPLLTWLDAQERMDRLLAANPTQKQKRAKYLTDRLNYRSMIFHGRRCSDVNQAFEIATLQLWRYLELEEVRDENSCWHRDHSGCWKGVPSWAKPL